MKPSYPGAMVRKKLNKYKLSRDVKCAGCAAKLDQKALQEILADKNFYRSENTLIGIENFDDAGVYRLKEKTLLVQSTDFFPPIVDDPYQFGQIATANALSDLYAMGAEPITALNICCFPINKYPQDVFSKIIEGSAERLAAAKCTLLGGHTIQDNELKFGIAATGIVNEAKLIANNQAKPGDILFLTKPLGTGIITTAIKRRKCPEVSEQLAIDSMIRLNKNACDIMVKENIKSATDITGFGLAGHALEMCRASEVKIRLYLEKLPVFENVYKLLHKGMLPGGSHKNKENNLKYVDLKNETNSDIIFDAQTSGGILMAVPGNKAANIKKYGLCVQIGEVLEQNGTEKLIEVI